MTKSVKKVVIGIFLLLIAISLVFALFVKNTAKAQEVVEIPSFITDSRGSIRLTEPYGIRFTTGISETDYVKLPDNAVFGTLIIPTSLLDGELTLETPDVMNVTAKVWQDDQDGTKFYNGVLVGADKTSFSEKFYNVDISARGYVTYVDSDMITHTVYSESTAERSVAKVAALALKAGENYDVLTTMVNSVVSSISFTNGDTVYMAKGDTLVATISGNEGLSVVFSKTGDISLSDETSNTVLITADDAGNATLTATLGTRTDSLNVVVKDYNISSNVAAIRGVVGDTHTITTTVTDGGEEVESGSIIYSANALQATIDGDTITPLVAGDIDVTVTYTDANGVAVSKVYTLSANTADGYLASKLSGNKLVNWNDTLWSRKVTDSTVAGYSMSNESDDPVYAPSVMVGHCYKFVPAQSGRNISFPVQNEYDDGYLKIEVYKNGGTFDYYEYIYVLKYGETNLANYVVKATGTTGDILNTGTYRAYIYVPVSMLTNSDGVLEGVQLILYGGSWHNIGHIEYVPASEFTPTYTTTTNLSSIALNEGGSTANVTASTTYCGGTVGSGFDYNVTVTSSDTSVATVTGTALTPVASGDTTVTVTFTDGNGNVFATDSQVIHVASYAEQVAPTLDENEFVGWQSALQKNLLTEPTIEAYQNKTEFLAYNGSPYYSYQFKSKDSASGNAATYAGHNIEFAVKNVYSASETGYIRLYIVTQRAGAVNIYKYGATEDTPVYSVSTTANEWKYIYVPIVDLINENNVLEGIQIIMRLDNGWGSTGYGYYNKFDYRTLNECIAATLGENELVNWKVDDQLNLVEDAVVNGYTGTLTNTKINREAAGYYNYQFNSSNSSTGRVQIEFAEKKAYAEGYVKIGLLLQSGWGQTSYVYKYGETANGAYVYSFTTPNTDRNKIIYHYIPVADLVNSEGILEGIQVVLTLGGSYGQIYDISYVTELPA